MRGSQLRPSGLPRWVVLAVAGGVFLSLSALQLQFTILAAMRAAFLMLAAGGLGLALYTTSWGPQDMGRSRLFKHLGVVLATAVLGVPFALVQTRALDGLIVYGKVLLLTGMVWGVCRHPENRLTVLRSATLGLLVACVSALWMSGGSLGRLAGLTYDANDLALVALMSLPLLAWYWLDHRNPMRWLGLLALPIPLFTLVRASSRGSFIGLGVMAFATVFLYSHRAPRRLRWMWPATAAIALAIAPFVPADTIQRARSITDQTDYNYTSDLGRLAVWRRGIGYAFGNPLVGVGVENFSAAEGFSDISAQYAARGQGFKWGTAHNVYVQALAELGLVGGGALILLIAFSIRDLFIRARSAGATGDPDGVLAGMLALSLVAFAVSGAFLSWAYYPAPYILIGITYGYLNPRGWRAGVPQRRRVFGSRTVRPVPTAAARQAYR